MNSMEVGTCEECGKEKVQILRKYYRYPIKCICCNGRDDNHFEVVKHCEDCKPTAPMKISLYIRSLKEEE